MECRSINPRRLYETVQSNGSVELLDVRTPVEYEEAHVDFATNVPLDRLNAAEVAERRKGSREPLYVICRSGNRARQAAQKLMAAGCEVVNVDGGVQAWDEAGLPLVRGESRVISLERQVRIAAGSLVLAGALLGFFVHPYWIALSAFVGAGLIFAGVTDTCGMAMLLARMPWNQVSKKRDPADSASDKACAS